MTNANTEIKTVCDTMTNDLEVCFSSLTSSRKTSIVNDISQELDDENVVNLAADSIAHRYLLDYLNENC